MLNYEKGMWSTDGWERRRDLGKLIIIIIIIIIMEGMKYEKNIEGWGGGEREGHMEAELEREREKV